MLGRLIGAIFRAVIVLLVVAAPAFLLPDVSLASQEISLIIGGIAGAFTLFEYASSHPGLIDFRYAPPYNRARFAALATQILALVFLCRATEGADPFSADVLGYADQAVALMTFPLSPVNMSASMIAVGEEPGFVALIQRTAAISFFITFLSLCAFAVLLWLFRWPVGRRDFNLWVNLPTFEPGYGRDVERRLRRDGTINVLGGLAFLYLLPVIISRASGWFDPSVLLNYQPLVWGATFWSFVAGTLVIRGASILKVAWLVGRTRR